MGTAFSLQRGSLPTSNELSVIEQIRLDITTVYEKEKHEELMRIFYSLAISPDESQYRPQDPCWKLIGFQNEDPVSDIRGGGILSLRCLIYFFEKRSAIAKDMINRRSDRTDGANYPIAAAGINVCRMLAILFEAIKPTGQSKGIEHSHKLYWHILNEESSFYRLFVIAFRILDDQFDELTATYMDFPNVINATREKFIRLLENAKTIDAIETQLK